MMVDIMINLVFILGLVIAAGYTGWKVYSFTNLPKAEQIIAVKEWLLWAVAEAEKLYGSGTGVLKLRYVYDLFLSRFGALEELISFDDFSKMVDEALNGFRELVKTNEKINNYVEKSNEEAK